jgi:hypothetical protein
MVLLAWMEAEAMLLGCTVWLVWRGTESMLMLGIGWLLPYMCWLRPYMCWLVPCTESLVWWSTTGAAMVVEL